MSITPTEKKIIEFLQKGDQRALNLLYENYSNSLYGVILKITINEEIAQDALQETFIKVWKNASKYDSSKAKLFTWLFRIATNNSIDFIRKKKLDTMSLNTAYQDESGANVTIDVKDKNLNPQEEAIKAQKIELIQLFVTKLPAKYQRLVRLRYFKELSYEEIARELEAPLGTVKAQLHRARELLQDLIRNKKDHI